MDYQRFVGKVQERAGLDSEDHAIEAIRAVLSTLGERLAGEEADHLAAGLPEEFDPYVVRNVEGTRWDVGDFLHVVGERAGESDEDRVRRCTQAVLRTVRDALPRDELDDVLAQLPGGIVDLFGVTTPRD